MLPRFSGGNELGSGDIRDATDMIEVEMRDDGLVDVFRCVTGATQLLPERILGLDMKA